MTIIYISIALLIGISALATVVVVGRQALRRFMTRRLLAQGASVRKLLVGMRENNYRGIDKVLFDMRDSYDLSVIEDELHSLLGDEEEDKNAKKLLSAFELLGLSERYLQRVRTASGWQERARCATALGQLRDPKAVGPLIDAMRDKREDSDVKLAAAEALGRIRDPAIIGQLCEQLGNIDEWASPRLAQVITAFGEHAVAPLLESLDSASNLNARIWAAQVLGKIRDRRATPALIQRLHDRSQQMRVSVANALGDIADNRAFRPLVEVILRDPVAAVRAQAAASLGRIGDKAALPMLVASLGDPEYWTRFRALEAIEALEPDDTSSIEAALSDPNPEVRRRAALALERLGVLEQAFTDLPDADPHKEAAARARLIAVGRAGLSERLARHLDDPNPYMRERIASLLGPLGDVKHAGDLVKRLQDDTEEVCFAAIESLGDLAVESTTPALIELLSSQDSMFRNEAVKALIRFPSEHLEDCLDSLVELMATESDGIRFVAIQVISMVAGDTVDGILLKGLQDRSIEVRIAAARTLGERGVEAAVTSLGRCLSDPNDRLRIEVATALGKIGGDLAIELLLAAMPNTGGEQRDSICATLAALGFDAIGPLLDVLMASDDHTTRLGAIWTLGKTGDPRGVPLLQLFLQEEMPELRSSAAGALGKIPCKESLQALLRAGDDPSPFVRSAAINGIGRIGSMEEFAAVEAALRDPDLFVRNRGAIAMGRLGGERAHEAIVNAGDGIAPEIAVIAMGLTGSASGIGQPLQAMKDPDLRDKVSEILEREEEAIRVIFFANLTPQPLQNHSSGHLARDKALSPDHMLEQFVEALRNSQNVETRRRAAAALAGMTEQLAISALCLALGHDPDGEVRERAARGLALHSDHSEARGILLKAIVDPQTSVRIHAIRSVGLFAQASEATAIFESLRSSDAELVSVAEWALAKIHTGPVEGVHDWMMGQNAPEMQACALRILAQIGDARSLGLISALLRSEQADVRVEAARALAALQVPKAIAAMLDALGDPVEDVRVGIIAALHGTNRRDVVERLEGTCFDPSVQVRMTLGTTLGSIDSANAVTLLGTLAADVNPLVAGNALLGLLASPDAEAQHHLLTALQSVGSEAKEVLRLGADPLLVSLRAQVCGSLDARRREEGIRTLAAINAPRYAEDIAAARNDPDAGVRLAAVQTLAEVLSANETVEVSSWLRDVLDDPVDDVRKTAKKALFRFKAV